MESKNDWYLISVRKEKGLEHGLIHLIAVYSNGLEETELPFYYDNEIPTILKP
jgi:hypothetical protein